MSGMAIDRTATAAGDIETLLDVLLYSVSHDLKSPLLTLSLSADLLVQATPAVDDDRTRLALDGLRHGAKDLERMLDALTRVSRAHRRPLEERVAPLSEALTGRAERADGGSLDALHTAVDARVLGELAEALFDERTGRMQVVVEGDEIRLRCPLAEGLPGSGAGSDAGGGEALSSDAENAGSPLRALLGSLTTHAGSPLETLAALEVQLARQGGGITLDGRGVTVRLPLAKP